MSGLRKRELAKIYRAKAHGIKIPFRAYLAARKAGIPFYVACAFLEQESAGGENVFGHDPTIFIGAGKVTKKKYRQYLRERRRTNKMQGVGPMQLTYYTYQDEADKLGGCWRPYINMLVGFNLLASYRAHGKNSWGYVGQRYNGSAVYGHEVSRKIEKWKKIILA